MTETRWRGWSPLPDVPAPDRAAAWYDLSHRIHQDMWRLPILPKPCIDKVFSMPEQPMNVTRIDMVAHLGTHVDAPRHFVVDGPTIPEVPLERWYGPGVLWALPAEPHEEITAARLDAARPYARPGDIVVLRTNWWRYFGEELYDQHPSLAQSASDWLVDHRVKLLAIDFATPDLAVHRRLEGFDFPAHRTLLSNGVLIAENLTRLDQLMDGRIELMLLPIPIEGSDGAPARIIARPHGADR